MKKLTLLLSFLLVYCLLFGQSATLPPDSKLTGDAALLFQGGSFMINNDKTKKKQIDGHPYLNEEWQKGWIYLEDGKRIEDETELLVNNYEDILHIKLRTVRAFNASVDKIDSIHLNNNGAWLKFISLPIKKVEKINENGNRLYQVMVEYNNVLLVQHEKKVYKKADQSDTYGGVKNTNAKYVAKPSIFIKIGSQEFLETKLKVKDLKKLFPKQKDEINGLIKQNRINVNKQGDFLKLLRMLSDQS